MFTPSFRKPKLRFGAKTLTALIGASLVTASFLPLTIAPASANDSATGQDVLSDFSTDDTTDNENNVATSDASLLPQSAGITMAQRGNQPKQSGALWKTPEGVSETTGDIRGLGHEQSITFTPNRENGKGMITISEPASRGGKEIKSFPTDVQAGWPSGFPNLNSKNITRGGLLANQISVAPGHQSIYVTETVLRENPESGYEYQSYITQYGPDGSQIKKARFVSNEGPRVVITAIDAIVYHGKKYVVIGLNGYGIRILDGDTLDTVNPVKSFYKNWTRGPGQNDTVSAVKFGIDENDRLLVATGKFTVGDDALYVSDALNGDSEKPLWTNNWRPRSGAWQWPSTLSFGYMGSGGLKLAVGWPYADRVSVMNATDSDKGKIKAGTLFGSPVPMPENQLPVSLRFFENSAGEKQLAVIRGNADEGNNGAVLGLDTAGALVTLIETSEKYGRVGASDLLQRFVPGYRSVVVNAMNKTNEDVKVQFFSSTDPDKGCWLNETLRGGTPFSTDEMIQLSPTKKVSPSFGVAKSVHDACASENGVLFAQVVRADGSSSQIVKILAKGNDLTVADDTGNDFFTFDISHNSNPAGSVLGGWTLSVHEKHAAPTVATKAKIVGQRLTPEKPGWKDTGEPDDPARPVFRFTVSGASWTIPGADSSLVETKIPAMRVQGSVNGTDGSWKDLGTLIPPTALSRSGETVTLGDASFDWQTASPTATNYTHFRVLNGDVSSEIIDTTTVPVPKPFIYGEVPSPLKLTTSSETNRAIRPNGLDQISARFSIADSKGVNLDPADPTYAALYDRAYYRENTGDQHHQPLITGLRNPEASGSLLMISPFAGSYRTEDSTVMDNERQFYISTTNSAAKSPIMKISLTGDKEKILTGSTPKIDVNILPLSVIDSESAFGDIGFQIGPCSEGTCRIADPTAKRPVLFSSDDKTMGIQFRTKAVNGTLPMGTSDNPAATRSFNSSPLRIEASTGYLSTPGAFELGEDFTASVVTHGARVNMTVKARAR